MNVISITITEKSPERQRLNNFFHFNCGSNPKNQEASKEINMLSVILANISNVISLGCFYKIRNVVAVLDIFSIRMLIHFKITLVHRMWNKILTFQQARWELKTCICTCADRYHFEFPTKGGGCYRWRLLASLCISKRL